MFSAIIPIRKNEFQFEILAYNGKSLLENKIQSLKNIREISEIIIASNDTNLASTAKKYNVNFYLRNEKESEDNIKNMVQGVASSTKNQVVIWTPCTTPFINENIIKESIQEYLSLDFTIYDSLITCVKLQGFIFDENGPLNFQTAHHMNSRKLPVFYLVFNGCFIASKELNLTYGLQWGKIPFKKIVDKRCAFEVKNKEDFEKLKNTLDKW